MRKTTSTYLVLVIITVIAVAASYYVVQDNRTEQAATRDYLLPELKQRINEAQVITLKTFDEEVVLQRSGMDWVLGNRDDYPADFGLIKNTLLAMAEVRLREYKTADPDLYPRLGVQGIEEEGSPSRQVVVETEGGDVLADIIIGTLRSAGGSVALPSWFARLPGEPRSLLVTGELDLPTQVRSWMEDMIMNVPNQEVHQIIIERNDGEGMHLERATSDDENYEIKDMPEGKVVRSRLTLNRMGTLLEELRVDDVQAADSYEFSDEATRTTIRTFPGLLVKATTDYVDGLAYGNFRFETVDGASDQAGQDADRLDSQLSGWVYTLPYFKYDLLARRIGDLVEDEGEQEAEPPAAEPATE